jgi:hypothetical protein
MGYRRPPVDVKALGVRLRRLRGVRSGADVVRSLYMKQIFKLTVQHLYVIEKGRAPNPGLKILDALVHEYETTIEFLLYGTKERVAAAR